MSVEFRNSSCVVSWFSNTNRTFWLKKRESTTTDTSVDSHWENVTSDDHMSSQSTPQFHLEWLWQLSTSESSDDQIMELCLRAIRLQRLCGVVVRSQLYRSLLFMFFLGKPILINLMLATCLLYRGLGHIEHSPTTAALASVRIYFGNFHLDRHML